MAQARMWWEDKALLGAKDERYSELRAFLGSKVIPLVQKCLGTKELVQAGKDLGLYARRTFVFEDESQSVALMDYALVFSRVHGTTPCERYLKLAAARGEAQGVLKTAHDALASVRFGFLTLEQPVRDIGVVCRDILKGKDTFLFDHSITDSGLKAKVVATALMDFEEGIISTGSFFPLSEKADDDIEETIFDILRELTGAPCEAPVTLPGKQDSLLARAIIESRFS